MASDSKGLGEKPVDPLSVFDDTAPKAVASAVLQIDERKIKACQKDIDTLLLVAGLFSAVLTPLLVESYHGLRQDPTQTMVSLLRQIARQTESFTLNNNFVNATSAVPVDSHSSDFTPTPNAKRVNILWFASLVLSLATASFCINVKQWLTEYLSQDYIPPLVRLRIRNFRYRGLAGWKVLEIAAMLPLLLQVSVVFFLVGLCYFTIDVHKTVGYTTLPLVIAWGIFFVISMFTPILWTKCPYQTPYLGLLRITNAARHREEEVAHNETDDIKIFEDLDANQLDDQFLVESMWKALLSTPREPDDLVGFVFSAIRQRIPVVLERPLSEPLDLRSLRDNTYVKLMQMVADIMKTGFDRLKGIPQKNTARINAEKKWLFDCLHFLLLSEPRPNSSLPIPGAVNHVLRACLRRQWRRPLVMTFIHDKVPRNRLLSVLQKLQGAFSLVEETSGLLAILGDFFPSQPPDANSSLSLEPALLLNASPMINSPPLLGSPSPEAYQLGTPRQAVLLSLTQARTKPFEFISRVGLDYKHIVLTVLIEQVKSVSRRKVPHRDAWKLDDVSLLVHILNFDRAEFWASEQQDLIIDLMQYLVLSPAESNTNAIYSILLESDPSQEEMWEGIRKVAGKYYRQAFWKSTLSERSQILYRFLLWSYAEGTPKHTFYTEYIFEKRMDKSQSTAEQIGPLRSCLFFLQLFYQEDVHQGPSVPGETAEEILESNLLWKNIFAFLASKLRAHFTDHPDHVLALKEKGASCCVLIQKISTRNQAYGALFEPDLLDALHAYGKLQDTPHNRLPEDSENVIRSNALRQGASSESREVSSQLAADNPRHPHPSVSFTGPETHRNASNPSARDVPLSSHSFPLSPSNWFGPLVDKLTPLRSHVQNGLHNVDTLISSTSQHIPAIGTRLTNLLTGRLSPRRSFVREPPLSRQTSRSGTAGNRNTGNGHSEPTQTRTSPEPQVPTAPLTHEIVQTQPPAAALSQHMNAAHPPMPTSASPLASVPVHAQVRHEGNERSGTTTAASNPNGRGSDVASSPPSVSSRVASVLNGLVPSTSAFNTVLPLVHAPARDNLHEGPATHGNDPENDASVRKVRRSSRDSV